MTANTISLNKYYLKYPVVKIIQNENRCYSKHEWPSVNENVLEVVHVSHQTQRNTSAQGWLTPSAIGCEITDLKSTQSQMVIQNLIEV